MKKRIPTRLTPGALAVLAGGALLAALWARFATTSPTETPPAAETGEEVATAPHQQEPVETHPGFLYGRVTTFGGATYEGRLRWGGDEEAFWGDYFNGVKTVNRWASRVPPGRLPKKRRPFEILGFELASWERPIDLDRPFMARFGDITRIEAPNPLTVRVTLKSGTVVDLDYLEANDLADGVRVWKAGGGIVDLGPRQIRTVELLPTPPLGTAPDRLHGTVHTRQGDFTGFLQWDREACVGSDTLDGRSPDGPLALRFDTLRSIARESPDSSRVTLADGRQIVLSGSREVGRGNRGVYVDDRRYGRVLVSWDAFERVDFSPTGSIPDGSGPAYGDFPPGRPLTGSVTTRDGRRLTGRLVYDLDESETTDTLDAPSRGVDYTLAFGRVASIALPDGKERGNALARVTLLGGEELHLELEGDLGEGNAGLLVFADGRPSPEYVPWGEVRAVDLDRPPGPAVEP